MTLVSAALKCSITNSLAGHWNAVFNSVRLLLFSYFTIHIIVSVYEISEVKE